MKKLVLIVSTCGFTTNGWISKCESKCEFNNNLCNMIQIKLLIVSESSQKDELNKYFRHKFLKPSIKRFIFVYCFIKAKLKHESIQAALLETHKQNVSSYEINFLIKKKCFSRIHRHISSAADCFTHVVCAFLFIILAGPHLSAVFGLWCFMILN